MTKRTSVSVKALHLVMALLLVMSFSVAAAAPAEAVEVDQVAVDLKETAPVDPRDILDLPAYLEDQEPKICLALEAEIAARPGEDIPVIIMLAEQPGLIEGELRVADAKLLAEAAQAPLQTLLTQIGVKNFTEHWIINAISATVPAGSIAEIAARPDVERVWLDEEITLPDPPEIGGEHGGGDYGDGFIRAPAMWDIEIDGAGIGISIIDTGICWLHPDLDDNKVIAAKDFTEWDLRFWGWLDEVTPTNTYNVTLIGARDLEIYLSWAPPSDLRLIVTDPDGVVRTLEDLGGGRWGISGPLEPPSEPLLEREWVVSVVLDELAKGRVGESYFLEITFDSPWDDHGHGTHVGGIAAGEHDQVAGVSGVAPGASLLNAKVFNAHGSTHTSWLLAAVEWSIEQEADILNLSLGGWQVDGTGQRPLDMAITHAVACGHIAAISAGNSGPGEATILSPAVAHGAIAVAASTITYHALFDPDEIVFFSSRGPAGDGRVGVDIAAPGVFVLAPVPLEGHEAWHGTSMSAPHVAGAAALLLQAFPALTPFEVERALKNTADDLIFGVLEQGAGRLDVKDAYLALTEGILVDHEWSVGRVSPCDTIDKTFTVINNAEEAKNLSIVSSNMTDTQGVFAGYWMTMPATVTVPAGATATFVATMCIPAGTPAGTYIGYITVGDILIPVSVNVMQPLGPWESVVITGTVDEDARWRWLRGDFIYYTIDVKPGSGQLDLWLDWTDAANHLDLYLFNPAGELVAMSLWEYPESIFFDRLVPGKWTVAINSFALLGVVPETYTLSATIRPRAITLYSPFGPPVGGPPTTEVGVFGEGFPVDTLGVLFVFEPGGQVQDFPQGIENLALLPASVIKPVPFRTDGAGRFLVWTDILLGAPIGEATFVACVEGYRATAPFMVWGDPTITLTPTDSYVGTEVTIAGKWFDLPAGTLGAISASPAGVIEPVPFEVRRDGRFAAIATILSEAPLGPATFKAVIDTTPRASAIFTVTAAPPFDFSLEVDPDSASVPRDTILTADVIATRLMGITEEVTLTYSLPDDVTGITVTFDPTAGKLDLKSLMTIGVGPAATVGTHPITIIATGAGELVREATFTLTVEPPPVLPPPAFNFNLEVLAALEIAGVDRVGVNPGEKVTTPVRVSHRAGPTEAVTLSLPPDLEEHLAEEGITVSFDPATGTPTFTATMTIAATHDATLGVHTITITGTGAAGLVRYDTFILTVTEFNFGVATEHPHWAVVRQGDTGIETFGVVLRAGIAENVTLYYDWYCPAWLQPLPVLERPQGVTISFTPEDGGLPTFEPHMHIDATVIATVGVHPMTIRGIASPSGLIREDHFTLKITPIPFDFKLEVEPDAATLTQGESVTPAPIVTATHLEGDPVEVTLDYSLPAGVEGIIVSFAPDAREPTFLSIMTIATATYATVGVHAITITGTGVCELVGKVVRTATFTLTVEYAFDFSLAVPDVRVYHGETESATVNVTHEAGEVEYVTLTYELPEDIAAEVHIFFKEARGEPDFMSSMTVVADYTVPLGEHVITITGTSATASATTTFTLTVAAPAPPQPPAPIPFDIHLLQGWNLISLPLIPENPAIGVVLYGILEDVTMVWHYDAAARDWKSFRPGIGGLLTEMRDGRGYWVNMEVARTLTVVGRVMPPPGEELPPAYPLFEGWNHIGFKSITPMTVGDYLGTVVMETFEIMWGFDAETGEWIKVVPGHPLYGYLQPGRGYWLAVTADGTIFPAPAGILE